MKALLIALVAISVLTSCATTGASYQRTGGPIDRKASYRFTLSEFHGVNVAEAQARQMMINAFLRNAVRITKDAENEITCTCELGVVTRDLILVLESAHHAKIECTIKTGQDTITFGADAARFYYSRVFLTLGIIGAILAPPEIGIPLLIAGAGTDIVSALVQSPLSHYQVAMQEAVRVGMRREN